MYELDKIRWTENGWEGYAYDLAQFDIEPPTGSDIFVIIAHYDEDHRILSWFSEREEALQVLQRLTMR